MTIKKIKVDMWVATTLGAGQVKRVGGTHPPSVKVRIVAPIPRGELNFRPRDIERELDATEIAALQC